MLWWALAGWLAGFVVNLLADALPLRTGAVWPPQCTKCGAARPPAQFSGILAFATRQERCARCKQLIGLRWPLVELTSIALFAYLAARFGSAGDQAVPSASLFGFQPTLLLLVTSLYTSALLLISVIDFEHRLILRVVIFPLIMAAAALSLVTPDMAPASALLGGLSGFSLTGLIYLGGVLFVRLQARRGRALDEVAFGQGDVWLMLFIGLIIGFPGALRALALGIVIGGLAAAAILVVGAVRRESKLYVPFAYGPYLAIAGWIVLVMSR